MRKLAFDIGANNGVKTRELLALGFDHVVAVEPLFDSPFAADDERVTWVESIVSDSHQPRDIYPLGTISTVETSFMEGRFKGSPWGEPVTVRSTTLESLMEIFGYPDYIKLDVEGHELSAIRGLPKQACVDLISFEWHSENRDECEACVRLLESMGYSKFELQFEDRITDIHTINPTGTADDLMRDFDELCESRQLPWGQVWAKL